MRPLVIFHRSDLDGVCSAAIVEHFVPDVELYGLEYGEPFPWDATLPSVAPIFPFEKTLEGNPRVNPEWEAALGRVLVVDDKGERVEETEAMSDRLPRFDPRDIQKRTVYMVDFSLPVEGMKKLAACSDLVWIDHHQTAISAYEATGPSPFIPGLRRPDLAACELCWNWFGILQVPDYLQSPVPEAVRLLGIYDSWRKDDPEWQKALAFQYGMRALPGIYSPNCSRYLWRSLFESANLSEEFVLERCLVGQAILNYQAEVNQSACESGAHEILLTPNMADGQPPTEMDSHCRAAYVACGLAGNIGYPLRAIACNTTVFNSQFFESVYDPEKHDIMVAYAQVYTRSKVFRGDLGAKLQWKVNLYSTKPTIDCGAIAKAFGGGGHSQAGGFVAEELPWA